MVQIAALAVMFFYFLAAMFLGNSRMNTPPDWIMIVSGFVSCMAVTLTWVQYKRGDLDEYNNRRRRAHPALSS